MSNGSAESLNAKLHRLFAVLVLTYVVVAGFRPLMVNVDLGWHIAQGRWMAQHHRIYQEDHFNYPNLHQPVVDEYPLFQVILYGAWSLGWWGPCLLTSLAYAWLVAVLIRAEKPLGLATSALPCMALGLMLLSVQLAFLLRPHVVTYLGVIILGIFLLRHREERNWKAFWPMALLQIAWANCHSGFILGPAMVGLFGTEMVIRRWLIKKRFSLVTIQTWFGAFVFVLIASLINPFGWNRFYLPFYQDQLESIRAYVGEMEPLGGGLAAVYGDVALLAAIVVILGMISRRGAISYAFLIFAIFFYHEAQSVQKAWPVFGLFIPLLVLSGGAFSPPVLIRKQVVFLSALGHFLVTVLVAVALVSRLDSNFDGSLQRQWREADAGRSELSLEAISWMRANHIKGRLFHRCEDGGALQQEGYDQGETFADTGFGKYDEAFIHEVGLVNERPALIPQFLDGYKPDFVVCSTFCHLWPHYLKQNGWRLIFYSPNSSVWTRPDVRTDLSTVSDSSVTAAFDQDLAAHGMPADIRLFGRNLIALNSLGLEDFSFARMTSLLPPYHHASWYWEAARILCFEEPAFSLDHRNALLHEAEQLNDDGVTAEFRAYCHNASGDIDGALPILEGIPANQLSNNEAELLLKIYLDRKRPEAAALARRTDCWDLRNGRHWQYLAQVETQADNPDAASRDWQKAVFYYPDDAALIAEASAFAAEYKDDTLTQVITDRFQIYGQK